MILSNISILNYKNLKQVELAFSPKINCFIGSNGMGKTNLLDAVYYLSFCKSATNPSDSQNISHDQPFFMLQGHYEKEDGSEDEIYCGMKRGQRKQFKHNKKEYVRFSEHIGYIPLVLVSPADTELISGGSDERRRFMDVVISQFDRTYLQALITYNKALAQRNALLKMEQEPDEEVMNLLEDLMTTSGATVYEKRSAFVEAFIPIFQTFYAQISHENEVVQLSYKSDAQEHNLREVFASNRSRDRLLGFTTKGIHKDDMVMQLGGFPIRREGSQGQNKTYLVALKLAQFDFLHRNGTGTKPLLLLDDIFDKLDASRVEQLMKLVAGDCFGQVFITDVNREHIDTILSQTESSYKLFSVMQGEITLLKEK